MKKIFITLITIILIIGKTLAKEKETTNNIYIGNKIGLSKYKDLENINIKKNNNQIGHGFFIGYKANKNLSFEIGYDWIGKIIKKKKFINKYFNSQGINISTKINYPLNEKLNLYTKIGNILSKSIYNEKNKIKKTEINLINTTLSPLLSLGIEYKINKYLFTRLDYQFIYKIGNKLINKEETNNNFLSINLIYFKKNQQKKKYKNINFKINFYTNNYILNTYNIYKLNNLINKINILNKYIYKIEIINYMKILNN